MTTLEILKAARELISVPERWTQKESARHKNGNAIDWYDPNASCWCSSGALSKVFGSGSYRSLTNCSGILNEVAGGSFVYYNDAHTHAEVLAMFDRAISIAEAENA